MFLEQIRDEGEYHEKSAAAAEDADEIVGMAMVGELSILRNKYPY